MWARTSIAVPDRENVTRAAGTLITALVVLTLGACRPLAPGGAFAPTVEDPHEVSFPELARYLSHRSGGLILPAADPESSRRDSLRFVWDPYDKAKVYPTSLLATHEQHALFRYDLDRFVGQSGEPDFLRAASRVYGDFPFDRFKDVRVRPYRCPASWGSLFHPPITALDHPLGFYHADYAADADSDAHSSAYFDPDFQRRLDLETQTELTWGNELRALFNGTVSYPEKLRLVGEARRFLYVAVMTMVADETGRELLRRMVRQKRAGVDVRLITDDFYTFSISNYAIGVLEREGIPVARVADKRLNQLDRMFHNKIWIRDGEEAILGGMNVLDYENTADGFNFLNRDTDILVRGPAVSDLLSRYIALWKRYDRTGTSIAAAESALVLQRGREHAAGVRGSDEYSRWLKDPALRMHGICRVAVQADGAEPQRIATLLRRYLEASRHSFVITSPEIEFDLDRPDPGEIDLLARTMVEKARDPAFSLTYITNGVDGGLGESSAFLRSRVKDARLVDEPLWAEILTPMIDQEGRNVTRRVRTAMRPLLDAGVKGYQYFNYMHAKEFYFDRLLVGIGSWNFDRYSAENNHESAIFCLDEGLRRQVERQMVLDLVNAVPLLPHTASPSPSDRLRPDTRERSDVRQ